MNTIGVRLRELRQSAKLSQAKIAAIVGSRLSAMCRWITFLVARTSPRVSCMRGK